MSQTPSDTFKLSYPFTTAAGTRIELVELKTPDGKRPEAGAQNQQKPGRLGRTADCPQYWSSPGRSRQYGSG
ncbi:putative phage-like protein [Escherichia coli]|nr:putative phage-like protein [Escherichia coli]